MSKIRIVNWLLTRKCNLNCDYCAIVKNYNDKPYLYPNMNHYVKNEMSTEVVIEALRKFKLHNPDMFHIFYGGEPLLRPDLPEIINYCNENNIHYTIISNNTPGIQHLIEKLFKETDYVSGFTSSVDPILHRPDLSNTDRIKKSIEGLKRLKEIQDRGDVKDVVAEITVMKENKDLLYDLVAELSEYEIYSDITFVDISKNVYYDFSNIRSENQLVYPTTDVGEMLSKIMNDDSLLIHMKETLLPQMFLTLPSNFDCELEKGVHNVSIDADGSVRLCLRIKGAVTPTIHVSEIFENKDLLTSEFYTLLCIDKKRLCEKCNHSCLMMSKYIDEEGITDQLIHSDKRGI